MSISSAPSRTAAPTSASFTGSGACPDGKAVATLATRTPQPDTASTAVETIDGYTHTAATDGQDRSAGSGRRALADSARTLPGVSAPSSVVRSTIRIARSIAHCLAVVLIDRVPSSAASDRATSASVAVIRPTSSLALGGAGLTCWLDLARALGHASHSTPAGGNRS